LFSQLPSSDRVASAIGIPHRRNRDGNSTRKFDVGVFTQPGSKPEVPPLKWEVRSRSKRPAYSTHPARFIVGLGFETIPGWGGGGPPLNFGSVLGSSGGGPSLKVGSVAEPVDNSDPPLQASYADVQRRRRLAASMRCSTSYSNRCLRTRKTKGWQRWRRLSRKKAKQAYREPSKSPAADRIA
jgi:hypothetical protein